MAGVTQLARLALAAVGDPPHGPLVLVTHCVTGIPKLRGNAGVGAVTQQLPQFPFLDLVARFRAELEIITPVVDGPGSVHLHKDAVVSVGDEVLQAPISRLQTHIVHADGRVTGDPHFKYDFSEGIESS